MRPGRCLVVAAALFGAAGCDRAPHPQRPVANRAHSVGHPACEDHVADITKQLRARWGEPDLEVRCAAGNFGAPGFFIEARGGATHKIGIVAADDSPDIADFTDPGEMPIATSVVEYAAADLDGDGVDEVIETWRKSAHGLLGSDSWLVVRRLDGHKLRRIRGPYLGVSHPELGACSASWHCTDGALVITVDAQRGIPPSDCLSPGTHRFVIRRGTIVERR